MAFHQQKERKVKYSFHNRTKGINLIPYKGEIEAELKHVERFKFSEDELLFLKSQNLFKEDFLDYLSNFQLNYKDVNVFTQNGDLVIEASGLWVESILWEIIVLSIVNEVYFKNTSPDAVNTIAPYEKLANKIKLVKEHNQKHGQAIFKFLEFGTRRRYSKAWQKQVLTILKNELPENLVATSNIALGKELNLPVSGTAAHEAYAAFQVISGLDKAHQGLWDAWIKEYGDKLGIVLTDIYTTEAFLADFTFEYASKLKGLRHDSGNPIEWLNKVVNHYKNLGINPHEKKFVFSDGLTVEKALAILDYAMTSLNLPSECIVFGIGTSLTNDFSHKALNIVMKMTECDGHPVIKISDEPSKAIGDKEVIKKVEQLYNIKKVSDA